MRYSHYAWPPAIAAYRCVVFQLPRHKAVVVRLNASDDSDSEIEASSSVQCVFGGLESMIKEARRSVEVSEHHAVYTSLLLRPV